MNLAHPKKSVRSGFTLVELLVVIVIIGVIMGLISAAVVKALGTGKQAVNQSEIRQLAVSVENFKSKYGFYPPSLIILCEDYKQYFNNWGQPTQAFISLLHQESVEVITRMWPRINIASWANPTPTGGGIDWNGNGHTIDPSTDGPVTLEGRRYQPAILRFYYLPTRRRRSQDAGSAHAHLATSRSFAATLFLWRHVFHCASS
jgi:prepilin-type N-terminal cleavage/methylation domain-containing protein